MLNSIRAADATPCVLVTDQDDKSLVFLIFLNPTFLRLHTQPVNGFPTNFCRVAPSAFESISYSDFPAPLKVHYQGGSRVLRIKTV